MFKPTLEVNGKVKDGLDELDAKVHLRVFKRNARKCITTIENLPDGIDIKKLLKSLNRP